jgi:hypothetical protein
MTMPLMTTAAAYAGFRGDSGATRHALMRRQGRLLGIPSPVRLYAAVALPRPRRLRGSPAGTAGFVAAERVGVPGGAEDGVIVSVGG